MSTDPQNQLPAHPPSPLLTPITSSNPNADPPSQSTRPTYNEQMFAFLLQQARSRQVRQEEADAVAARRQMSNNNRVFNLLFHDPGPVQAMHSLICDPFEGRNHDILARYCFIGPLDVLWARNAIRNCNSSRQQIGEMLELLEVVGQQVGEAEGMGRVVEELHRAAGRLDADEEQRIEEGCAVYESDDRTDGENSGGGREVADPTASSTDGGMDDRTSAGVDITAESEGNAPTMGSRKPERERATIEWSARTRTRANSGF